MPTSNGAPTREQIEAYSRVFEDLTDPVIVEDLAGFILDMNPEAEQAYGWRRDELLGTPIKVLVPPDQHELSDELVRRCRDREIVRSVETARVMKSGEIKTVLVTLSLLTDQFNEPIAIASVAKDVTALKRARQAVEAHAAALEHSNQKLLEFTQVCSHDLHAPLRGIAGFAEVLQKDCADQLDETANGYLICIVDSARRMQALIDDLLAYARADAEELLLQETDTNAVVDEVLADLAMPIRENDAWVTRDTLPAIRASRAHIVQVFQNLIANGIKFCQGRRPKVHVAADDRADDWLFSVQDNGIGIRPEDAEVIFRPFKRLHTASEFEGTGVGLATCQKVIQRHGGRIWVESQPGTGSTFCFTIPKGPSPHACL